MSDLARSFEQPGIECTFLAGDLTRTGVLALWRPGSHNGADLPAPPAEDPVGAHPQPAGGPGAEPGAGAGSIDLIVPAGSRLRRVHRPAQVIPVVDAVDALVGLRASAPAGASVHAWAHAARAALHLVARGRLVPGAEHDGTDVWRAGPMDRADLEHWRQLAEALPPSAHAVEIPGSAPRRVASPAWLLARFRDAVVDAYVRTAGAADAAGHDAFASPKRVTVAGSASWLVDAATAAEGDITVALRVETGDGDDGFRAVLQIGSRRDPSLVLDAAELWAAPATVAARFGDATEDEVLLALRRAARVWPPVARLLDEARPEALELGPAEVDDLLGPLADDLSGTGLDVLWPAGILTPVRVAPTVASEAPTADRQAGLAFDGLCELRWAATVDGEQLTDDELRQLTSAKRSVIRLRGRWVQADPARLGRIEKRHRVTTGAALAAALGGELLVNGEAVEATVEGPIADLAERLAAAERRHDVEPPDDLEAELRPYQRQGLSWLANMADIGFGGVLADDMGLGKTVQFLALHLHRRPRAKPTLVVCPVSVLANWEREAARFAPSVPVLRHHGASRSLDDLPTDALVLTTYGTVRRSAAALGQIVWGLVAADEAQAIKNPLSRTARAMRALGAEARFALTGTPVENRLVDLWALLDWTTPGLLGPLDRFRHEVAIPVERDQDTEAAASLARLVRPFVLRRRKVDPGIAPELPPKTETDRIVALTAEQATLYAAMVEEIMDQVEKAEGMARRGLVLKLLSGLKQICNHPAQFLHQRGPLPGRSGKLDAMAELVDTIVDEGESVLVFTQFVAMGHLLTRHLATDGRAVEFLHGSVPIATRQAMVDRLQEGETPVLVISVKAGGTGLNLTRATHVIHYDRWWNPAVEDQASDRAWRIGQDRPVQVHRLICEGTVEDRIAQMLAAKRTLADAVITTGEGWVGELADDDLRALVALSSDDGGR